MEIPKNYPIYRDKPFFWNSGSLGAVLVGKKTPTS
jgi:hypothetical protein